MTGTVARILAAIYPQYWIISLPHSAVQFWGEGQGSSVWKIQEWVKAIICIPTYLGASSLNVPSSRQTRLSPSLYAHIHAIDDAKRQMLILSNSTPGNCL